MPDTSYHASPARYLRQIVGTLALAAFFALFQLPLLHEPILLRTPLAALSAFMLYLAVFKTLYVLNRDPSLVIGAAGIRYRISPFKAIELRWQDIDRIAIETSSRQLQLGARSTRLSTRFMSVYPREPARVLKQMPLLQRFFGWNSARMGYSPLFIHELAVDAPLDQVADVMERHMRARALARGGDGAGLVPSMAR